MHQTKRSNYAEYVLEKSGKQVIEKDYGFITYTLTSENIAWVHDIFVRKDVRNLKLGTDLVDEMISVTGCKEIQSNVICGQGFLEEAIKAHLAYGFKVFDAQHGRIYFKKEVIK